MKVLNTKPDLVSIKLNDGRVILVKEQEVVILGGKIMNKCKVGYDDAEVMGCALKTIFADTFEEIKKLRESKPALIIAVCKPKTE